VIIGGRALHAASRVASGVAGGAGLQTESALATGVSVPRVVCATRSKLESGMVGAPLWRSEGQQIVCSSRSLI